MERVLQVVNIMDRAGIETFLMNYYRNINKNVIQFDFLTHREKKGDYDEEIKKLGGKIYSAPRLYPNNYKEYFSWMNSFFMNHPEYKIIHSHIDSMSFFPLTAAKLNNIPIRIAHSHSTKIEKNLKYPIKSACRYMLPKVANHFFSCGIEAGDFLFGKNCEFEILKNAIEVNDFMFQKNIRHKIREKYNLQGKFVLGHVGRFNNVKNHKFLIDIFLTLKNIEKNSILLLIGTGELEKEINQKVKKLHLEDSVHFLGSRSNVNEFMQAMDVFILPSLYEGLPVVGIEAQASGLPCIFSNRIPKEVGLSSNVKFIDLNHNTYSWAKEIISFKNSNRINGKNNIEESGYGIDSASIKLQNKYIELVNNEAKFY